MKTNLIITALCLIIVLSPMGSYAKDDEQKNQSPTFEIMMLIGAPQPMHMMGSGFPAPRPEARHERMPFPDDIKLTDAQREKMHKLGKKHRNDINQLHNDREAVHERYQEKFEAVLTDEQFRKIEKMRKELRNDMKKLDERQQKLFEQHRNDFEAILTDEQKKSLRKKFEEKK